MKIIGERVLLERIEREAKDGFETVDVLDEFVSKGRIVAVGSELHRGFGSSVPSNYETEGQSDLAVGNTVLFAKFSPDTQELKLDGKDMKIVAIPDIIAVL